MEGVLLANVIWILSLCLVGGIWRAYVYFDKKNYPFQVLIHNDQLASNSSPIVDVDKARLIKVGEHGEQIYWLKKNKVPRVAYGRYVGQRKIAFSIVDGQWYNITYSALDRRLMELGIEPLDRSARMVAEATVVLHKPQFKNKSDDKQKLYLVLGMVIILAISGYILYKNISKSNETATLNLESKKLDIEYQKQKNAFELNFTNAVNIIIARLDDLQSGNGLRPAPTS